MKPKINDSLYYEQPSRDVLNQNFGARIQQLRTLRGLTQKMLAERLKWIHFLQSDVSQIECGKRHLTLEIVVAICQALQVTDDEFTDLINDTVGMWVVPDERTIERIAS